jgi:hypothetical protein
MTLIFPLYLSTPSRIALADGMNYNVGGPVSAMLQLIDGYEDSGDINPTLAEQLRYRLTIIRLLKDQQAYAQANAYAADMLHYIQDPSVRLQNLISASAVSGIEWEANELMHMLQATPDPLLIVENGVSKAVVIISPPPNADAVEAEQRLVHYVQKSTGAALPVMTEQQLDATPGPLSGAVRLYVGTTASAGEAYVESVLQHLDRDGFVIHSHGNSVTIIGPSRWGTLNGVHAFLEKYVGVRWLLPGPDGEDVPVQADIAVPRDQVLEEPAFTERVISPLSGSPYDTTRPLLSRQYYEWAQVNRLQGNYNRPVEFHHNLYSLFSVSRYGASNPEFYPKGKPPAQGVTAGWQPCFSEPGTVAAAVYGIVQYFQTNPDKTSYSLGVNDSRGFCEADPAHPAYPNKTNSLGLADLSDLYYGWVNEVVGQVAAVYPDKWFGLIAYQNVVDPPSFPLHPKVIPFLTKDRMTWLDPVMQSAEHQRLLQWEQRTGQTGWYDYMYGSSYVVPRVYPHLAADHYSLSLEHGTTAHYVEMYPSGSEGPKAWVTAKLMWNPEQDVDDLLEEWYERTVGTAAAPDLAAYYDLWESFWTERVPLSPWFQNGKAKTFLPFTSGAYLDLVTEADLTESRSRMEAVVDKAGTAAQQVRANKLMRAFELVEAAVLSYPKQGEPPTTIGDAMDILDHTEATIAVKLQMADKRDQLIEAFKNDPILALPFVPNVEASGWNKHDLWDMVDYIKREEPAGGPITDRIGQIAAAGIPSPMRDFARLLKSAAEGAESLTENSSFETGSTGVALWKQWIVSTGTMKRSVGVARTGNASMQITGLERGGPYQTFPVNPGLTAARVHYYVPAGSTTDGTIQLSMNIRGDTSANLATVTSEIRSLADTAGEWATLGLLEQIPEVINNKQVKQIQFIVVVDGLSVTESVYIDDAIVLQGI